MTRLQRAVELLKEVNTSRMGLRCSGCEAVGCSVLWTADRQCCAHCSHDAQAAAMMLSLERELEEFDDGARRRVDSRQVGIYEYLGRTRT